MKTRKRLDQWLANLGYCSRSEAKLFAKMGRVTQNGQSILDPATKLEADGVLVDGEPLDHADGILVMLHKPVGEVCTHSTEEGPNIYSRFPPRWTARNPMVTSIGRLDKDTSGLILVTDQSELVHRLTSPKHKVPKVYLATLEQALEPGLVEVFASGTLLLDGEKNPCLPAKLEILSARHARVTLLEGRYHQVRRMFAASGNLVTELHRTHFGDWELGDLSVGAWRFV